MGVKEKQAMIDIGKAAFIFVVIAVLFTGLIGVYVLNPRFPMAKESFIEIFQEAFLFITALLFWVLVKKLPSEKGGLLLIAGFFSVLWIREMDAFLDFIHHSAWFGAVVAFLIPLFYSVYKSGMKTVLAGLAAFVRSDAFFLMAVGIALLLTFGRMIGSQWLWSMYLTDVKSVHSVRRFIEEAMELLSYTLIMLSALRYYYLRK